VFSVEATGRLGGAFLFPAIVGLCRPNHGGRQCWETVPSRGLAWLDGPLPGCGPRMMKSRLRESTGGTQES
jgi:hypothetical protein